MWVLRLLTGQVINVLLSERIPEVLSSILLLCSLLFFLIAAPTLSQARILPRIVQCLPPPKQPRREAPRRWAEAGALGDGEIVDIIMHSSHLCLKKELVVAACYVVSDTGQGM
jgi:hypothetical protein